MNADIATVQAGLLALLAERRKEYAGRSKAGLSDLVHRMDELRFKNPNFSVRTAAEICCTAAALELEKK